MRWLDVAGCPAVGKSTLCDGLWPRKVEWDGIAYPKAWDGFVKCAESLAPDPECRLILTRYFRKIATLGRVEDSRVYINTGLAQAGLEIGWRLDRPSRVADYFWLMPVSVGVVFLWADIHTLRRRNRDRLRDRSHMVEGMEEARAFASGVLRSRGVKVLSLDTSQPVPKVAMALQEAAT